MTVAYPHRLLTHGSRSLQRLFEMNGTLMLDLRQSGTDVLLPVNVQPRASRNAVTGLHGHALKLSVTAPPVDGAANEALVRFLAERLEVPRSAVRIEGGASGRSKVVLIDGIDPDTATRRLLG